MLGWREISCLYIKLKRRGAGGHRPIEISNFEVALPFTLILNERLNVFSDEYDVLNENQASFRKKYSTVVDFFIHRLFELLRMRE